MSRDLNINLSGRLEILHDLDGVSAVAFNAFKSDYAKACQGLQSGSMTTQEASNLTLKSWARNMESDVVSDNPNASMYRRDLAERIFRGPDAYRKFKSGLSDGGDVGTLTANAAHGLLLLAMAPIIYKKKLAMDAKTKQAAERAVKIRKHFFSAKRYTARLRRNSEDCQKAWADLSRSFLNLKNVRDSELESGVDLEQSSAVKDAADSVKKSIEAYEKSLVAMKGQMLRTIDSIDAANADGVKVCASNFVSQSIASTRSAVPSYLDKKFLDVLSSLPDSIAQDVSGSVQELKSVGEDIGVVRGVLSSKAFSSISAETTANVSAQISGFASGEISTDAARTSISISAQHMRDALSSKLPVSTNVLSRSSDLVDRPIFNDAGSAVGLSVQELEALSVSMMRAKKIHADLHSEKNRPLVDKSAIYDRKSGTNLIANYGASVARSIGRSEDELVSYLSSPPTLASKEMITSLAHVGSFNGVNDESVARFKESMEKRGVGDDAFRSALNFFSKEPNGETDAEKVSREKVKAALAKIIEKVFGAAPEVSAPSMS